MLGLQKGKLNQNESTTSNPLIKPRRVPNYPSYYTKNLHYQTQDNTNSAQFMSTDLDAYDQSYKQLATYLYEMETYPYNFKINRQ